MSRRLTLTAVLAMLPLVVLAETRALVAAGLGGTPDYQSDFQRRAQTAADALRALTPDVTLLLGDAVSRERIHTELQALRQRAVADDVVVVMLIGHGTYDEREYRFNVPGPDVTGGQLRQWLETLPARRQLVVAATSASGALQEMLPARGRTLITATRSGGEANATVFHRYFARALTEATADVDKDGHVSASEAFGYASAAVTGHYEQRRQMATEHPVLEGEGAELVLARLQSTPGFERTSAADEARLADLETQIVALRADKANREPDAYYAELQRLMLEVALLRRQVGGEEASP